MARQTVQVRAEGGTTRDAFFFPPDKFTLNPDNPRTEGPALDAWIEWLAGQFETIGYLPGNPFVVRRDEARTVESGNCRLRAVRLANSRGSNIKLLEFVYEPEGITEQQRISNRFAQSSTLGHSPAEYVSAIIKFRSWQWADDAIAKALGQKSGAWVESTIKLAAAPDQIQQAVRSGEIAQTLANQIVEQAADPVAGLEAVRRVTKDRNGDKIRPRDAVAAGVVRAPRAAYASATTGEAVQPLPKPPISITPYAVRVAEVWSEQTEEFRASMPDEFRLVLDALRGRVR